jgi:hypothetical protein
MLGNPEALELPEEPDGELLEELLDALPDELLDDELLDELLDEGDEAEGGVGTEGVEGVVGVLALGQPLRLMTAAITPTALTLRRCAAVSCSSIKCVFMSPQQFIFWRRHGALS